MIKLSKKIIAIGAVSLVLHACSNDSSTDGASSPTLDTSVATAQVLATVNGEPITQVDVDFMISRTFSGAEQLFFDEKMQAKVLESLVASTAMRQAMVSELSADQLKEIENKAKAYKEELFVKEYLVKNAAPEPVSTQMVKEYYDQYPEEFGGGVSKVFEMLATPSKSTDEARNQFLIAAKELGGDKNTSGDKSWQAVAKQNANSVVYSRSTSRPGLLAPKLASVLSGLSAGEASEVVMVDGSPHLIRVLEQKKLAAQPLNTVSAEIRKKLAAIQLKKAVKKASNQVIKQAAVEYR